ncbi:MAG: hypothetical protein ACLFPJ_02635 [Candidatus Woesearchaeota archaeon]
MLLLSFSSANDFLVFTDKTDFEMCKGEIYTNKILIKSNIDVISFIDIEKGINNVFDWSSFSLTNTIIEPHQELEIFQFFNPSFDLKDGLYENNFFVKTNSETFNVKQNINLRTCNNVGVSVYQNSYSNCACKPTLYYVNITNTADNYADVFSIYTDLPDEYYSVLNSDILVAPKDTKTFVLSVILPCDKTDSYEFNLFVESKSTDYIAKTPLFLDIRDDCYDFDFNLGLPSIIYENQTEFEEFSYYEHNYFEFCKNNTYMVPFQIKNVGEVNNSYNVEFKGNDFFNLYFNSSNQIEPNSSVYGSIIFDVFDSNLGYYKSNIEIITNVGFYSKNYVIEKNLFDCDYEENDESKKSINKYLFYLLALLFLLLIVLFVIYYFFVRKKESPKEVVVQSKLEKVKDNKVYSKKEVIKKSVKKEKKSYFWIIFFIVFIVLLFGSLIILLFLFYLIPFSSTYYVLDETALNDSDLIENETAIAPPPEFSSNISGDNESLLDVNITENASAYVLVDKMDDISKKSSNVIKNFFGNNFLLILIGIILFILLIFFIIFLIKYENNLSVSYKLLLIILLFVIFILIFLIVYFSYYSLDKSKDISDSDQLLLDEEIQDIKENSTNYVWHKNTVKKIDLTNFINDSNKDQINLSLAEQIDNLTVEFNNLEIVITPDKDWYGERNLELVAENVKGLKTYNDDINLVVLNKEKKNLFYEFIVNNLVLLLFIFLIIFIVIFLVVFNFSLTKKK